MVVKKSAAKLIPLASISKKPQIPVGISKFPHDFFTNEQLPSRQSYQQ
jgi:hypothetical protein